MIAINVPDAMMSGDTGGYRWVVAIAAFFTQFIICGITYSIGVFHIVFSKIFNEDHFNTSWIGSILLYSTALTSELILIRTVISLKFYIYKYQVHVCYSYKMRSCYSWWKCRIAFCGRMGRAFMYVCMDKLLHTCTPNILYLKWNC